MNDLLSPLQEVEYSAYRLFLEELFAKQTQEAYGLDGDYVLAFSQKTLANLMPNGFRTANAYFYKIMSPAGDCVGNIWFALEEEHGRRIGFIRYIHIDPAWQRKGFARQAILALEEKAKNAFGLHSLQLNVYGFNKKAQALYASLGFAPLKINMEKRSAPSSP